MKTTLESPVRALSMRGIATMSLPVIALFLWTVATCGADETDPPPVAGETPVVQTPGAQTPVAQTPQTPLVEAASTQAPAVHHDPVAWAEADAELIVRAQIVSAHRLGSVVLHYRHPGEMDYRSAPFGRTGEGWAAHVPAAEMIPGVLEYFIASEAQGAMTLHFASPSAPHPLIVIGESEQRWRRELLAFHYGNRSRFQLASEYVDFGGRRVIADDSGNKVDIRDHYWRLEGDYTYRILAWIYSIRLGVGLIRGDTYQLGDFDSMGQRPQLRVLDPVGLTYGFAEVRFRLSRIARLDLRTTLGAGPLHFDGGAGGTLIIGDEPGTHFALGIDGVTSVGARGFLRLGWNTVPRVPMSFTIEITNLPFNGNVGGRVFLSAGYRFNRYFSASAYLGYATRDFRIGGPGLGLNTSFEF